MSNSSLVQQIHSPDSKNKSDRKKEIISFLIALFLINGMLAIWSYYDCALPVYDMACHLLSGSTCADLFAHAHPAHGYWWRALLAVNPLYPPFTYLVYGICKLCFGPTRWIEILVRQIFSSILFASLYGLGKTIFNSRPIALLAGLMIFVFPTVFVLTHYDMLDIPGLAMVCLALYCLIRWQQHSSPLSSMLLGIACSLTALTKNNAVAFLIAPFLVSLLQALLKHDWQRYKQFFLVVATSILVMLPWLIFACRTMLKTVAMYQNTDYHVGFAHHIFYYLTNLPVITSYFLFAIFILALFKAPKLVHQQMIFMNISAVGGIFIISLFHWTEQIRYALPATIPIALYSAWLIINYWHKDKLRAFSITIVALSCFAFIQNNFSPYPLFRLSLPQPLAIFLGIEPARLNNHHAPGGTSMYPTPPSDWGYEWVFKVIKDDFAKNAIRQNSPIKQFAIMPDSEEVSSTSYAYLAKRNNLNLHPFTPRNYTLLGDQFTFLPETAKNIDWYLLKTGSATSPASHFCNKESADAYVQWCNFVRQSGLFKLMGLKPLPDGTQLELYKKR